MTNEDSALNDPITPAPTFAYRAFRGYVFGSPESSPEMAGKENIVPPSGPRIRAAAPAKSNMTELGAQRTPPPPKRTSDGPPAPVSPSKGILRTPGVATPRAKLLKDVNVKFKSVSPESEGNDEFVMDGTEFAVPGATIFKWKPDPAILAQGYAAGQERMNQQLAMRHPMSSAALSSPGSPQSKFVEREYSVGPTQELVTLTGIDHYIKQTEKETKILINYGRKMRDYARRVDAQNQDLRMMVERLEQRNAQLEKAAAERDDMRMMVERLEQKIAQLEKAAAERHDMVGDEKSRLHPVDNMAPTGRVVASTPKPTADVAASGLKPTVNSETSQVKLSFNYSSTAKVPSTANVPADTSQEAGQSPKAPKYGALNGNHTSPQNPRALGTPPASQTTARSSSDQGLGTTNLAPDREAAARDRVKRRFAQRRASANDPTKILAPSARGDKGPVHAALERKYLGTLEQLEVDWANMKV